MARTLTGVVTSDKADKTIVISVHARKTHPIYKKQYSVTKKFIAHDEDNSAHIGDKVIVTETRPISRRKRFTLLKIVDTAKIRHDEGKEDRASVKKVASIDEAADKETK